jgi:hypothetical protein
MYKLICIQCLNKCSIFNIYLYFKYFSTSPEQVSAFFKTKLIWDKIFILIKEPPDFVPNFLGTVQLMLDHPEPLLTYFKDNKPHVYKRICGKIEWEKL